MASKRPRRSLDELESEALFSIVAKLHDMSSVKSLSTADVLRTSDLSEKEISAYLIVKFGAEYSMFCAKLPRELPNSLKPIA